jgi:hypothetical protein
MLLGRCCQGACSTIKGSLDYSVIYCPRYIDHQLLFSGKVKCGKIQLFHKPSKEKYLPLTEKNEYINNAAGKENYH